MKNQLFVLLFLSLLLFVACQQPAAVEETETPDYVQFDKNLEVIRAFMQAHCDENLTAQKEMLADTFKWSPPYYNNAELLGTEEYLEALKSYHDNFENIKYTEGIKIGDELIPGMWSGSHFPQDQATMTPEVIRAYGTWNATHTESQKEIGVKWFGLCTVNEDGKIVGFDEYWDVHGLAAQIAEE